MRFRCFDGSLIQTFILINQSAKEHVLLRKVLIKAV